MGVFTFVCRESGDDWTAKQLNGELEASASCAFDLQRKLVHAALSSDSNGAVQSSFSYVSPSSAVFQVIVGGGGGGGGGGFVGSGAPAASGGGAAAEAAPAEEKKVEKEESDDDMGFSLFD